MAEVQIKFHNTEFLLFQEQQHRENLKNDFAPYLIKLNVHQIDILQNKNQKLCTFFSDHCDCKDFKPDLRLEIYQVLQSSEKRLVMEIKCQSQNIMKDITNHIAERKHFIKYKGPLALTPAKQQRTSLLSTESPEQDYRGFLNVLAIALLFNHFSSIVESLRDHGFFINNIPNIDKILHSDEIKYIYHVYLSFIVFIANAFIVQKFFFKKYINSKQCWLLSFLNVIGSLIFPVWFCRCNNFSILPSIAIIIQSCIIAMKLTSYSHVMRNVFYLCDRIAKAMPNKLDGFVHDYDVSAENLEILRKYAHKSIQLVSIKQYAYFLLAPTLCYQIHYPRNQSIRKWWLLKRIIELVLVLAIQAYLWFAHLQPVLQSTYQAYKEENRQMTLSFVLLKYSKLTVPSTYFWLAFFFGTFQVYMNILAEVLRFADRQFYLAWWNCKDLEEYWKLWNLPVHSWFLRHLYNPLLKRGLSRVTSGFIVFFVSAVFHEWVVSGALGVLGYQSFLAMLLQAPIIFLQKKLNKILGFQRSELGNVMFWLSFCFIGQPVLFFTYYIEYMDKISAGKSA